MGRNIRFVIGLMASTLGTAGVIVALYPINHLGAIFGGLACSGFGAAIMIDTLNENEKR